MAALALTGRMVKHLCLYHFIQQRGQHQIHPLSATRRQKVMFISVLLPQWGWGGGRLGKGACKDQKELLDAETEKRTGLDLEEKYKISILWALKFWHTMCGGGI